MITSPPIKIASRSSKLALWQAEAVKLQLEKQGHSCEIIKIESSGDVDLKQPIYSMGITGVFTKQLDAALLNGKADIAVHSLKDVPTRLAEGLALAATLPRGAYEDVVVVKNRLAFDKNAHAVIATGSLRRKAQWLAKYPKHEIVPIRGNVQTRLEKLRASNEMDAMIFAKAGLERLNLLDENTVTLDWMLPAPAQGIIGIVCREDDKEVKKICAAISDDATMNAAIAERQFMQTLQAGCSVPVSALALISGNELTFKGAMHSFDGTRHFEALETFEKNDWPNAGMRSAEKLLQQPGAKELLAEIKNLPK